MSLEETTGTETNTEAPAKKTRAKRTPPKKFMVFDGHKVHVGVVASEVGGFLSANSNVDVYRFSPDQITYELAPENRVNEKFVTKTVATYND